MIESAQTRHTKGYETPWKRVVAAVRQSAVQSLQGARCSPNFGTLLAHQAGATACFRIRVAGESTVSFKIATLPILVCENRSWRTVLTTFESANRRPSLDDWRGVCRLRISTKSDSTFKCRRNSDEPEPSSRTARAAVRPSADTFTYFSTLPP